LANSAALGIVYRAIATHLTHKAGFTVTTAKSGAVTLIQRFGGALNLNIHFHMLFLDGVYIDIDSRHGTNPRFRRVKAPTSDELTQLAHTIARRIGRYLERRGLLERDTGNCYLTPEALNASDEDPSNHLLRSSITYRIAVGSQQGHKASASCSRPSPTSYEMYPTSFLHAFTRR